MLFRRQQSEPSLPAIALCDALEDEALFGAQFEDPSWQPWRVVLAALEGRALDDEGLRLVPRVHRPREAT